MRTVRTAAAALGVLALGAGTAAAVLTVPAAPATVTATARSLTQVTGVTATAGLGTATIRWTAEASGLTTGYRVLRYAAASGGTGAEICSSSRTSTSVTCTDTAAPAVGAFYSVTALLTPSGASVPAWFGPESARAGSGATVLQPPSVPDLATSSDSGVSTSDNLTNAPQPVFTGTGTTGATVTLSAGGVTIGSGTVANGVWSITVTGLTTDGLRSVTATQTLLGSTSAASGALAVTIDRTAPVVTVTATKGNGNSGNGTLNGTLGTLSGDISSLVVLMTQGTITAMPPATITGSTWSATYNLGAGGSTTVKVTQQDTAGNTGTGTLVFSA